MSSCILNKSDACIFFKSFLFAWIFFLFFPHPPHHFSNGPSLTYICWEIDNFVIKSNIFRRFFICKNILKKWSCYHDNYFRYFMFGKYNGFVSKERVSACMNRWEICRRWPKNRGQKQSSLHFVIHSEQSRMLARSCFSWRFFALQINGYSFKNRSWIYSLFSDDFFCNRVIERSEYGDVNMGVNTIYVELWFV
jgi:hypothetical protein